VDIIVGTPVQVPSDALHSTPVVDGGGVASRDITLAPVSVFGDPGVCTEVDGVVVLTGFDPPT
jgi:hypothetical protein